MRFKIDNAVLERTKRCRKDFSCLGGNGKTMCQVESQVKFPHILVVQCRQDVPCDYLLPYRGHSVCCCPTRNEIYSRYWL